MKRADKLINIMELSVEQINQIYVGLQEYPTATQVAIRSEVNGTGLGPSEFVDYYEKKKFAYKGELLGTIEITDEGMW